MQHAFGDVVGRIHARTGDRVEAGQVHLRLDGTDIRSELTIIEQQLAETTARIARLRAERDGTDSFEVEDWAAHDIAEVIAGQERLFRANRATLENELAQTDEQIVQTREQVRGVDAQIDALDLQIALLDQEIDANARLDERGLVVRSKLRDQQRDRARLMGERGRLIDLRGQHLSAIASLELGKIRLDATLREKAITELRDL